jgi:hypothetical protein
MKTATQSSRNHKIIGAAALLLPLILATPSRAYGYADPGTGAFIYQAAYAAFLGGTFYLRKFLNRLFGKRKPVEPTPSGTHDRTSR